MSGNVARLLYLQETGQQLLRVSKSVLESLSTSSVPTQIPHAWQEALLAQGNLTNLLLSASKIMSTTTSIWSNVSNAYSIFILLVSVRLGVFRLLRWLMVVMASQLLHQGASALIDSQPTRWSLSRLLAAVARPSVPSSTIVAQVSKLASKYSSTTPATASAGVTSSPPAGLWQQVSQTWDHSAKVFALVRFAAPLLLNSVQSTRHGIAFARDLQKLMQLVSKMRQA